eukprot:COSAG02_NODE_38266_length_431_cov_0.689759_1_plen_110_part_10
MFVAAYNFEGFAKTATESGINVADRALNVTCEIQRSTANAAGRARADITALLNAAGGNAAALAVLEEKFGYNQNIRYDIFAQTDMIIYIAANGEISTTIQFKITNRFHTL